MRSTLQLLGRSCERNAEEENQECQCDAVHGLASRGVSPRACGESPERCESRASEWLQPGAVGRRAGGHLPSRDLCHEPPLVSESVHRDRRGPHRGPGGPILLGTQDKAGSRTPASVPGSIPTSAIMTGARCPASSSGRRPTMSPSILEARLHHPPGTAEEEGDGYPPSSLVDGQFVRSFGKEWHGGEHGIEVRRRLRQFCT